MKRALVAAALCAAAACHPGKPPPPRPGLAPPAAPDAGPARDPAQEAWERRDVDPAALDKAVALFEEEALRAREPAPLLLGAARARRARMARLERRSDLDAHDLARALSDDARACASDAHRSWSLQFPAAGVGSYAQVGAAGAEALYLEASCAAAWARLQGFTPLIERRNELTSAFRRVAQLAPDLDGAGPERELGALLAALPAYAGGDLEGARKSLEAALARAPKEPRNRLVLARTVAVKAQDRALFEEQLRAVIQGGDSQAAGDAAALLQREDELFGPAESPR